jgi:hypothetical protein
LRDVFAARGVLAERYYSRAGVIAGRYCRALYYYSKALLRDVIAGQNCGTLLHGVIIAWRYCRALLQYFITGCYCGTLLRGVSAGRNYSNALLRREAFLQGVIIAGRALLPVQIDLFCVHFIYDVERVFRVKAVAASCCCGGRRARRKAKVLCK